MKTLASQRAGRVVNVLEALMANAPRRHHVVRINRAPVLTLWAAVVAERLGFDRHEALTLGRAVAGLNAYSKGVRLGLIEPTPAEVRQQRARLRARDTMAVDLLHRAVSVVATEDGLRALTKDTLIEPASVERYLAGKFGEALVDARAAMMTLARSFPPAQLASRAYGLYERFRPDIPACRAGWGAAGDLDLEAIRALARPRGGTKTAET